MTTWKNTHEGSFTARTNCLNDGRGGGTTTEPSLRRTGRARGKGAKDGANNGDDKANGNLCRADVGGRLLVGVCDGLNGGPPLLGDVFLGKLPCQGARHEGTRCGRPMRRSAPPFALG